MNCSFVILTWNRSPMLEKCLEMLVASIGNKNDCEIIIYDNFSPDNPKEVIESFYEKYSESITIKTIYGQENVGLSAYKKLFSLAKGNIIIEVDDDILQFPSKVDEVFKIYFEKFKDFGYLALDVVQNEHTTGAKPDLNNYKVIERDGMSLELGPTGGWCTGFRRRDFNKIKFIFNSFNHYNFKHGEDGFLSKLFRILGKKSAIIPGIKCFQDKDSISKYKYSLITWNDKATTSKTLHKNDFAENWKLNQFGYNDKVTINGQPIVFFSNSLDSLMIYTR